MSSKVETHSRPRPYSHLGPQHKTPFPSQIDLYAGALFVHICLGWNFYLSTLLMLAITALYTIAGTAPRQGRVRVLEGSRPQGGHRCSGVDTCQNLTGYQEPRGMSRRQGPPPPTGWAWLVWGRICSPALLAQPPGPTARPPAKGQGHGCGQQSFPEHWAASLSLLPQDEGPSSFLVFSHRRPGRCDLHRRPANTHHGGGGCHSDCQR